MNRLIPASEISTRRKIISSTFGFLFQVLLSTGGAILLAVIAVSIPAILVAALTRNDSGGNFADHIATQHILALLAEPYFIAEILAGFTLGFLAHRFFRSSLGVWVWVVPTAVLCVGIATWKAGSGRPYWHEVWNNYFSAQCGSSECAYEWLVTAPCYTSIAYAVGWIFWSSYWRKRVA